MSNLMNKTTNEQNRTRGMETRNRLTVTRGKGIGSKSGRKRKEKSRNMCE